jgi:predicted nucleotidyltransferase
MIPNPKHLLIIACSHRKRQRIVQEFNPERIIVFGSHAYGRPAPDSDVDLLIVMESDERPATRASQISKLLRPRPFPMDILVRTPQEIQQRLEMGDYFIQEILERGKVLYERPLRPGMGSQS